MTERHSENDLVYDLPLKEDGDYTIILQFSEVKINNNY